MNFLGIEIAFGAIVLEPVDESNDLISSIQLCFR